MIHHRGILYLAPFLIPLAALARPVAPPRATPLQVPVNSRVLGADGTVYTFSGVLQLQVDAPIPIPPPPTDLKVSYLSTAPPAVTAGQSATVTVQMTRVAGEATNVSLTSSDSGVRVPSLLTIPAGQDKASANVVTTIGVTAEKLVSISAKYGLSGGYSNLRVMPDAVPIPAAGDPSIVSYLNGDGSPITGPLLYGQEVRITGSGFGTTPGKVFWQGGPVQVLAWSDTLIRVKLPIPVFRGASDFQLQRSDGIWVETMIPTDLPARVPGNAKRR